MPSERDNIDRAHRSELKNIASSNTTSLSRSASSSRRSVIGIFVSSGCRRLTAAMVTTVGRGLDTQVEQSSHLAISLGDEVRRLYRDLVKGTDLRPASRHYLATRLAEEEAELVARLLDEGHRTSERILAVGVHDPGLWDFSPGKRSYSSLCDAAMLAESTGHCIVDGFPARDVACGGLGGPLLAVPLWMMLHDQQHQRLLVDLGRTVRATWLPPGGGDASRRVVSLDVGPGTSLLDRLASKMTDGRQSFDAGGHMAVQGRKIPELAEHWLADSYFKRPAPRWHPLGCRHEHELSETVRMAIDAGWSIRDLLCTACHFIAETIAQAVSERVVQSLPTQEILLCGRGQQNGMLLRGIASRLPDVKLCRISDMGLSPQGLDDDALEPTAVALLSLLHIDQVPANQTVLTGTDRPRILGRLTPGLPQNWQRLLRTMAESRPPIMSLRSAV